MHLDSPAPGISQIRAAHTSSEKASLVGLGAPAWQASIWYSLWVEVDRCQCLHSLSCSSWWTPFLTAPGLFFFFFFYRQELLHASGGPAFAAAAAQKTPLDHLDLQALLRWLFNLLNKNLTQRVKQNEEREEYVPTKRTRKKDFNKIEKKNKEKRLQ